MNMTVLIGRLGKDVDLKYLPGKGTACAEFSIATNRYDKTTDWHNIVVFGKSAENCSNYLHKGSQVCVKGELQYDNWEKDGVKKTRAKIVAERVEFLDSKQSSSNNQGSFEVDNDIDSSEIPF